MVLKTRPFGCNPAARAEIHSLISHFYIAMYIAAIKSLLRFYDDIAVIIHDDGTLTDRDKILLEKHIPGIGIIEKKFADRKMAGILRNYPNSKIYRASNIIATQLFDYAIFSKRDKYISLDSDTLFLRRPDKLIDWIAKDRKEIVCLYEMYPAGQGDFLSEVKCDFPPHICAGFFCFPKQIFNLDKIEKILDRMESFGWFTTQNALPILIKDKAKEYKISFFNPDEYQDPYNFKEKAVFRHYWSSLGAMDTYTSDVIEFIIAITKMKTQAEKLIGTGRSQ